MARRRQQSNRRPIGLAQMDPCRLAAKAVTEQIHDGSRRGKGRDGPSTGSKIAFLSSTSEGIHLMRLARLGTFVLFLAIGSAAAGHARADSVADFYRGKQISLLMATTPG